MSMLFSNIGSENDKDDKIMTQDDEIMPPPGKKYMILQ